MSHPSPSQPRSRSRRVWHLNLRALGLLAAILVLLGGGLAALAIVKAGSRDALVQAQQLVNKGQDDLALSYLNNFLDTSQISRSDRVQALDLKAQILTRQNANLDQLRTAVDLGEQALRFAGEGPLTQNLRRRQLKRIAKLAPFMPPSINDAVVSQRSLYTTGDRIALDLIKHGASDAEALRLHARMLEGLATSVPAGIDNQALDQALDLYEKARALDPADLDACVGLANLYRDRKNDPQRGLEVLQDLVKNDPRSVPAHLALFQYQAELVRQAENQARTEQADTLARQARQTLNATLKLDPRNLQTHLAAAEFELTRNHPERASSLLEKLPENQRADYRAQALLGLANLQQNHPDQAIEIWRQGLLSSNGTDANLTWRLAYTLLNLGRLDEAKPLMIQFRRLTGSEEPVPASLFLDALKHLKQNRPAQAIPILEAIRLKADDSLLAPVHLTLGQCYEAVRNPRAALDQYAKALDADPSLASARLARLRLLRDHPQDFEAELRKAIETLGENPDLLLELARLELRKQNRKPAPQRDWSELKTLTQRLEATAPGASGLLLLQTDLLLFDNKQDQALKLLEQATKLQKSDPKLWITRADLLRKTGKLDQAVLVLEQALSPENAGDQAPLRIALAQYRTLQGQGQEAREQLVQNLDRLPPDQRPDVWKALGDLYAAQRNAEGARQAYTQWAELLPDDPLPHHFLMQQALADNDREEADKQINILQKVSGQRGLFWRIARVEKLLKPVPGETDQAREGRFAEARGLIDDIRVQDPQDRYAYLLQGQLLEAQDKKEQAAAAYEQALRHDAGPVALARLVDLYDQLGRQADIDRLQADYGEQMPSLDRALAEAALRKGDNDKAEALAAKVVKDQPENLDAHLWQARLLSKIGKPDQARATLQTMIDQQPSSLQPRLALLTLLVEQNQKEQASQVVEQIITNVKNLDQPELTYAQCWQAAGNLERATSAYEAALQKWPEDPRVIRASMTFYDETTNQADKAETLLDTYLRAHPDERWAARALAVLRSNHPGNLNAWQGALELLQDVDPDQANLPEERLAKGIVLARSTKPADVQQARDILSKLLLDLPADYPSAATARNLLVRIDLNANQPKKAAAVLAIDANAPNPNPQTILQYASILLDANQPQDALRQLDRLGPDAIPVQVLRARALKAAGQPSRAADLVRQALDDHKDEPNARQSARVVLNNATTIDPNLGVEIARRIADLWPADLWLVASTLARQDKNADQALDIFLQAVPKADPGDLPDLVQNALALVTDSGSVSNPAHLEQVAQIVQAAFDRQPDSDQLLTMLGYLRHFQQRYDDEVKLHRQALEKNPGNPQFLNNLAWALCEGLNQPKDALPYVQQAFEASAANAEGRVSPQFFDTRGVILTRLHRLDDAIDDLEIAARARPTGVVLAHLARAYHLAGQTEKFQATAQRALDAKLNPNQFEPNERKDLEPLLFPASKTKSAAQ